MKQRTYRADSMAQALIALRRDLGENAVILRTRTRRIGGVLGLGRRTVIEVTASGQPGPVAGDPPAPPRPPSSPSPGIAAYTAAAAASSTAATLGDRKAKTRRVAQEMLRRLEQETPAAPVSAELSAPLPSVGEESPSSSSMTQMKEELSAIRSMVSTVLDHQAQGDVEVAQGLESYYTQLIAQELSESLAQQVLDSVSGELGEAGLDDEAAVRHAMIGALGDHIPVAEQPLPMPDAGGGPLVVVLVGPTGVGKTTTIAKLAATYRLRRGLKVGLVTADTYRIAAVEQLRTYAHILGVPLHVAQTPPQLADAIGELSACDVILVDTAGRGQRDQVKLDELSAFVKAAMPDEVHLVLSGTTSEAVLLKEAEAFACVGIDRVALTKLDETVHFGVLINVMDQLGTALSFVTTGQEVPEDLSEGCGRQLADLVMGGDLIK